MSEGGHPVSSISFSVFSGGLYGCQVHPFTTAFDEVKVKMADTVDLRLDIITNKMIHEDDLSEEDVFMRLLEGDVHVILGHMHQGNPKWSALTTQELLGTLAKHIGWPARKYLKCPVLTQDKIQYIQRCQMVTIPTLKINFIADHTEEIFHFIETNDEGEGWILKLPFTTNGEGLKFCKSVGEILRGVKKHAADFGGRMSYSMLQPCLANRKEYKVVLLGGTATFVADIAQRSHCGVPFSSPPHTVIKAFAERVCEMLESQCDGALALPMLRVDIMHSKDGLVVNEFESLEACYFSKHFDKWEASTFTYLQTFWKSTIESLVQEELCRRTHQHEVLIRPNKCRRLSAVGESNHGK